MRRRRRRWLAAALGLLSGCGEVPLLDELSPERTCRRTVVRNVQALVRPAATADAPADSARLPGGDRPVTPIGDSAEAGAPVIDTPSVEFRVPRSSATRRELDAWCAAVGPAVLGAWGAPAAGPVDSIAVVSWNVHVGGGDLRPLIRDLRSGALTGGGRVEHFALLLQEAYREGDLVPEYRPGLGGGSDVGAAPPSGIREDLLAVAEDLGLHAVYVPSMRSGEPREDRGNAIVATLPLHDLLAIELPVARQRRVAAVASVAAETSGGEPWSLQLASVHFENDARGWANDERARLEQGEALLDALPDADAAVAAGDFNTWRRAQEEAVIRTMLDAYPDTRAFPPGPTYIRGFGVVRKYLDYMFFRLPEGARSRYARAAQPYNSDHFPLVGWVVFARTPRP